MSETEFFQMVHEYASKVHGAKGFFGYDTEARAPLIALHLELEAFREREPLVQELLWAVNRYAGKAWLDDDHYMVEASEKVKAFGPCTADAPASAGSAADSAVSDSQDAAESQGKG